jgi:AraC family transcriptional regulator
MSRSDARWGGLDWVQAIIHSTPTVRRAVTDAARLMVVVGGAADVTWRKQGKEVRRKVSVGSITYLAAGHELEDLTVYGDQNSVGLELNPAKIAAWTGEDVAGGALRMHHLPPHVVDMDPQLLGLFSNILTERDTGFRTGPLYAESLSLTVLSYLWGRYSLHHSTRMLNGLTPVKLSALKDYMHATYQSPVTLGDLSAVVGMTPRHLSRCFKEATGLSPYRYLIVLRIEGAKQELRRTERSLTEVAGMFGFASLSHFSATFKQIVGQAPVRYRRGLQR